MHEGEGHDGRHLRTRLDELVALIVHEVRIPLTIVNGASRRLGALPEDGSVDPALRSELLAMIARNATLASLLLDRLSLARDLESGAVHLEKELVDLADLVRVSVRDLRTAVLTAHAVEVGGLAELTVEADPTALREIVLNLLSNAAKYSAEYTPIEVVVDRDGDTARAIVRDHGEGVAADDADRIFDAFVQANPNAGGIGLGLYISRELARAHDGELSMQRGEGGGSEFVLRLPAPV